MESKYIPNKERVPNKYLSRIKAFVEKMVALCFSDTKTMIISFVAFMLFICVGFSAPCHSFVVVVLVPHWSGILGATLWDRFPIRACSYHEYLFLAGLPPAPSSSSYCC